MLNKKTNSSTFLADLHATFAYCPLGLAILFSTLLLISILVGFNLETNTRVYVAGEVADRDIIADRDLLVMDTQATEARRKQLAMVQPQIYDLSFAPYSSLHSRILDIFSELNNAHDQLSEKEITPELKPQLPAQPNDTKEQEAFLPTLLPQPEIDKTHELDAELLHGVALEQLREDLSDPLADEVIIQLAKPQAQTYILNVLLPQIQKVMQEGIVGDIRSARVDKAGIIIRNLDTKAETLIASQHVLPDVQSFLSNISSQMREKQVLDSQMRRAINILLSAIMPPSLTLNREVTLNRANEVAESMDIVYYQLQKGERVVRKGDRVSREQQMKLQALHNTSQDIIDIPLVLGVFIFSCLFVIGLFFTPNGKLSTPLTSKDLILISSVLFCICAGAKIGFSAAVQLDSHAIMAAMTYGYPVSAGVGLIAMVFAARRYLTISLLLSFYFTLIFGGDFSLFLFHFLSAMIITRLVTHSQSRQDVVIGVIPLALFQLLIFIGSVMLQRGFDYVPIQAAAVIAGALLSLFSLFAISPLLEMVFGYTTRFRLMELMSLEHPLMQAMMANMPGTYHHSFVVANMVEAGAKAVGANSILCKVAALYHDVGKLAYPSYFIENQFGGENKHDKLAPSMSALVIIAHVKKGTELAEKYKLGKEIEDIIRQHHGTQTVSYFFNKALQLGENPKEIDYAYPGPRPQTKEAAIIMLADAVEASSRTLSDPTPARIRTHIDTIIKKIFADGQLDESELTFKDLHLLSECFVRILMGIFHQRIAYPPAAKDKIDPLKEIQEQDAKEPKTPAGLPQQTEKKAE